MYKAYIFLGATVADAAARPLHWVYDPKKLKSYTKNKKEVTFLKQNKSPFYSVKTGNVSGYNDVGKVMFKTLITTKKKSEILKTLKKILSKILVQALLIGGTLNLEKNIKRLSGKNL